MVVPAPWWEQTGIFCSCSNLKAIRNSDFKETPVYCTDPNQQLSRKGSASLTSSLLILVSALPVTCLRGGRKLTRTLYSGKKASLLLQEAPQRSGLECPAGTAGQSFASALILSGGQEALRLAGERFARQLAPDLDLNRKLLWKEITASLNPQPSESLGRSILWALR